MTWKSEMTSRKKGPSGLLSECGIGLGARRSEPMTNQNLNQSNRSHNISHHRVSGAKGYVY
jgi:hypothetical protein